METFHFLRPLWLLGFVPLLLALWRWSRIRYRAGNLEHICDAELLPFLLIDRPGAERARRGLVLTGTGAALAIIALAGPVWERLPVPVFRNENALVIVLDLSTAMDATDLKPSRLERARYKIADLLRSRREGQTGLVVYAGDAFTVTPLTDDTATIASQLGALSTELSPVQGQRTDLGLDAAVRLLKQAGVAAGQILLIASDADSSTALDAARRMKEAGYRLSVLGVGTEAGGPVPRGRGGLWKDASGNILVPKLNPAALKSVAEQGDGLYRTIAADSSDIDRLSAFFEGAARARSEASESQAHLEQWLERGPWLVVLLLPLAALAFRRGGLVGLWLLVPVLPEPCEAFEWRDLWSKPDRRAATQFERQHYEEAARQFDDPTWRGAAWYRAGKYQEALHALKEVDTTEAWYNKGNALAQLGQFAEAIAAYRKVLERNPEHADAKYNKEFLEQFMKKKERKKDSGSSGDQEQGEKSSESQSEQQPQNGEQETDRQAESGPRNENGDDDRQSSSPDAASEQPAPSERESEARQDGPTEPEQAGEAQTLQSGPGDSKEEQTEEKRTAAESSEQREVQQANEQWLRRIPDDPAGLLKRKFAWQYRQRQRLNAENAP